MTPLRMPIEVLKAAKAEQGSFGASVVSGRIWCFKGNKTVGNKVHRQLLRRKVG